MRLSDHLGKGIWAAADKVLPVVYGVGFVVLVIRVLPEIELGNFVLIQEIFLTITGLAQGLALQPLLKFASEERSDREEIIGSALFLNVAFIATGSLLAILFHHPFALLLNSSALDTLLLYLPLMLLASFIRNFALILLQTRFRMQQIFWTDATHFIGAVILVYVWSRLHIFDSALDLITINLISLSASSVIGLLFARDLFKLRWRPGTHHIKQMWDYGKYVSGGLLSYLFYSKSDSFFLSAFTGPAQVGVYNSVKTFVRIFDTMQQVIQMFVIPAAARFSSVDNIRSLKVMTEKTICFGTIILMPIFLLFVFFASPLLSLIYNGRFVDAAVLLQIFGVLSFLTTANAVASNLLLGLGHAKAGFYISIVLLVSSAILYWLLVPWLGALGATIGYVLASLILTWITVRKAQTLVPFTWKEVLYRINDVTAFIRMKVRRA